VAAAGLLKSTRPRQWVKNGIVFFGLVFALKLNDLDAVTTVLAGFVAFTLASGAVYLVNDIVDVERDRLHPRKRLRPIASGILGTLPAGISAGVLFLAAILGSLAVAGPLTEMVIAYCVLMLLYTFGMKSVVMLDVFVISGGFVIRAVAGALIIDVPVSPWLYVFTALGSLFIAVGKRRQELVMLEDDPSQHRRILGEYSVPLLDQLLTVIMTATMMSYSLYTFTAGNLPANHSMMLTIPLVLYGLFRYSYLIHIRGQGGSPDELLFRDKPLLASVILWAVAVAAILYIVSG
jgi:4-hydroxybenzoate polyprenyltransferase